MHLQSILAMEGLPEVIVTDNGTQFTSAEFKQFCSDNSIKLFTTASFHSASNGKVERFVRTFKKSFNKRIANGCTPHVADSRSISDNQEICCRYYYRIHRTKSQSSIQN